MTCLGSTWPAHVSLVTVTSARPEPARGEGPSPGSLVRIAATYVKERTHVVPLITSVIDATLERVPIAADAPRYAKMLDALLVAELVPERIACKHKLGQHRPVAQIERVLAGLWKRGEPGDLRALRQVREAHPARPVPAFLRGPEGSVLCAAPDERAEEDHEGLAPKDRGEHPPRERAETTGDGQARHPRFHSRTSIAAVAASSGALVACR